MPSLRPIAWVFVLATVLCRAGPYSPPAGEDGSHAVARSSGLLIGWAVGYVDYLPGLECDPLFQTPERALGPASGDTFDIVSLGRGGRITLRFDPPITDGPGPDFAVFENGFDDTFLELAYVEVSSDGVGFVRFPCDSLTMAPVPAFGALDSRDINGLAGTFAAGYGTPFDLADLSAAPGLDRSRIRWVRLVDVVGDGSCPDSSGDPIYDPYPTLQSAGFDLEAIGVIHPAVRVSWDPASAAPAVRFPTAVDRQYWLEFSADPAGAAAWSPIGSEIAGDGAVHCVRPGDLPPAGVFRVRIRMGAPP